MLFSDAIREIKAAIQAATPTEIATFVVQDSGASYYTLPNPVGCAVEFSVAAVDDESESPLVKTVIATVQQGDPPATVEIQTVTVSRPVLLSGTLNVEQIEPDGKGLDVGIRILDNLSRNAEAHRKAKIAFVESGKRWSRALAPVDGRALERWSVPIVWRLVLVTARVDAADYWTRTRMQGTLCPIGELPVRPIPPSP